MAEELPPLPPGFTLDAGAPPPPPPGFTIDAPPVPAQPVGLMEAEGFVAGPVPPEPEGQPGPTPGERFLDSTAVGRVMRAFGHGVTEGFGDDPLGLSEETAQELRNVGIFPQISEGVSGTLKLFNEVLIRPAAVGLDAVMRGASSVAVGAATAVGQTAEELGADQGMARRLTRDTLMLADTLGVLTATSPTSAVLRRGRTSERPKAIEAPETPAQLYDKSDVDVVDRAGNINLDRIQAAEDVKDVIREAANAGDDFTEARRGVMSLAQTEELADALGMTSAQLTKREIGQAFNAEEAVAARNLLVQSANNVRDFALKAAGGAEADLLKFQEAVTRHQAIQEQVAGLTAEAGRALSSFRIMAQGTQEAKDLGKVIDSLGGRTNIEDMARKISELETPQQISKFAMDARGAKASDMVIEVWINALLSGPQTHATNVLSNSLFALWSVPETAVAAGIGKLRQMTVGADDRVLFGEAGARTFGLVQGARQGIVAGWRSYKTEVPTDAGTKLEARRMKAVPSATVEVGGYEFEIGGKQVRIPGRMLMAEDAFFQAIGYRQELNALAYRQASKEGLKGEAFARRVAEMVNSPTLEMTKKARDNAERQTFTNPLGKMGQSVQAFTNAHPLAKVVAPFVRTPVNIVKQAVVERTPLGLFSEEVRANLSGKNGEVARDQQAARLITGSAVGAATVGLAAEGLITGGGPTDPRQRAVMYLTGWQPYSVRIGDMHYSYGRLEPLAMVLGVSADMYDVAQAMTDPEATDLANLVVASISKNLISKTWLQGPSDLIQALQDPDRYGERWLQKLAGTVVPTGVAQIARSEDPFLREARSTLDVIKSRIPGMSEGLMPRRDIWGEPISLGGSAGPDLLSPIYTSRLENDPVNQELLRLQVWPARLDRKINGVELTPEQYDEYQRVAGRLAKQLLNGIVAQPGWYSLPPFVRQETISRTITRARGTARGLLKMKHPNIIQDAVQGRMDEISGGE